MGSISQTRLESSELSEGLRGVDVAHGLEHGYVLEGRRGGGDETVAGGGMDTRPRVHGLRRIVHPVGGTVGVGRGVVVDSVGI